MPSTPSLRSFMKQEANCFNFFHLFSLFMHNKFPFSSTTIPIWKICQPATFKKICTKVTYSLDFFLCWPIFMHCGVLWGFFPLVFYLPLWIHDWLDIYCSFYLRPFCFSTFSPSLVGDWPHFHKIHCIRKLFRGLGTYCTHHHCEIFIKSSRIFIEGNRCKQFWSTPLLGPFEVGARAPSPRQSGIHSSFHVVG